MVLLRVTPTTALPTARQLAGDLGRWVGEAGRLQATQSLPEKIEGVAAHCSDTAIELELLIASDAVGDHVESLATWLGVDAADIQ